jgi:hypothetical protein
MAWEAVRRFIDKRVRQLGAALIVAVAAVTAAAHFFHPVEDFLVRENLWGVLIIGLLVIVLDHLVELHPAPPTPVLTLCTNHAQATSVLEKYVTERKPARADLIEYSAFTIHTLLTELRDANCEVRLLVQHPDSAQTSFQESRIRHSLASLVKVTFERYNRVEIRCYRVPGTVRARCFDDDYVIVGWYRYMEADTSVTGHTNPMIAADGHSAEGRDLIKWFRKAFEDLWTHSVDVSEVPLDS